MNNHYLLEEGEQEAAIEAFRVAHEGHTHEVEVRRGTWSIYCHCKHCGEIHTYEVDNEARERALGLRTCGEMRSYIQGGGEAQ